MRRLLSLGGGCAVLGAVGSIAGCVLSVVLIFAVFGAVFNAIFAVLSSLGIGTQPAAAPVSIRGMPAGGVVTATFQDPAYLERFGAPHRGVDIANRVGTPVYSTVQNGVVTVVGADSAGYGNYIKVQDLDSGWVVLYAHLNTVLVKRGEVMGLNRVIGEMGETGNVTGPHLHYEIRRPDGGQINPEYSRGFHLATKDG